MIRDAVLHLTNEQPLLADLFAMPAATDSQLLCTNLRSIGGKRPVWVDDQFSTFVFPVGQIRFIELPVGALDGSGEPRRGAAPAAVAAGGSAADSEGDLDIDEDFLRRVREA